MTNPKRKISVFIASPRDLSKERTLFKKAIHELNIGFGDGANVEFEPLGWEDTLASTGRRSQSVLNTEIDRCDVFILAMYRRWGQEAPDAKPFQSYTEEEFHRALDRWNKEEKPEIFVFFKRVDPESEADPGPQLKKVMDFRKQLEDSRQVLYHYFDDDDQSFIDEVDRHLRAYAKDELPKLSEQHRGVILPLLVLEEVENAKTETSKAIKEAELARDAEREAVLQLEAVQLQMAEDAAQLSKEGKIEYARQKFSELVTSTNNIKILSLGYEFYYRTGDLNSSFEVLKKWLDISGPTEVSVDTADAYKNLGNLSRTQGEILHADELYKKALVTYKSLGCKEGMAKAYTNLGLIYSTKGELQCAEDFYLKALKINEAIGRKEGIARTYTNLGNIYYSRGELQRAEEFYLKALEINETLGNKEGFASDYTNLGIIYKSRGELQRAEKFYLKSLEINQTLDNKEGIASNYTNLGNLYYTRGELQRAEEFYRKALEINEALGNKEGLASDFGNLGIIFKSRGKFQRAEKFYLKALEINQTLDNKESIASNYTNLGNLYYTRGELKRSEEFYRKALTINETLDRKEGIVKQYTNLGNLYYTRGKLQRAEEFYQKALSIELDLGHKEGIAKQYTKLGFLYFMQGELERAEELYLKVLAIEEALGCKKGIASQYANLGFIYRSQGKFQLAEEFEQRNQFSSLMALSKNSLSFEDLLGDNMMKAR